MKRLIRPTPVTRIVGLMSSSFLLSSPPRSGASGRPSLTTVVPSGPRLSRFTLVPRSVRHSLRSLGALLLSSVVGTERRPLSSFAPEGYGSERVDRREDRDKLANLSLNHLLSVRLVCYSLRSSFGPFLASTSGPLVLRFPTLTSFPSGRKHNRGNEVMRVTKSRENDGWARAPVPVTHILTLSGRSLQSQPFHRESFYVTGTRVPFSSCRVSPPSLRSLGSSLHSVPEPVGCRERSGKGRAEGQGETRQKEPGRQRLANRKTPYVPGSFSLGPSRLVSRVPRPSVALRNRLRSFASHGAPAVRSPRSLPAPYLPPRPPSPVTTDRPSLAPYVGRSCRYASAATRTGSVRPKGPFHGRTGPAARSEENVDNERSRKADMETDDSRHSHG